MDYCWGVARPCGGGRRSGRIEAGGGFITLIEVQARLIESRERLPNRGGHCASAFRPLRDQLQKDWEAIEQDGLNILSHPQRLFDGQIGP